MNGTFSSIVEEVQKLSLEEKEELRQLLGRYIVEVRRQEIYNNYLETKRQAERGELKSLSDIQELRRMLEGQ